MLASSDVDLAAGNRAGKGRRRLKRAGAIATSAVTFTVAHALMAPSAHASNFGSTSCGGTPRNCVSLGDNAAHSWYPEGTFGTQIPGIAASFQEAMNDYEYYTDLTTTKKSHSTLDVLATDYNYGSNGAVGWVECLSGSSTSGSNPYKRCDRQSAVSEVMPVSGLELGEGPWSVGWGGGRVRG